MNFQEQNQDHCLDLGLILIITNRYSFKFKISDGKYNITAGVGSGLTIEQKQSQFLTGILSIQEIDILPSMYFFTDVRYHIDWVSQIYKDIRSGSVNLSKTICSKSGNWSSTYRKLCSSEFCVCYNI